MAIYVTGENGEDREIHLHGGVKNLIGVREKRSYPEDDEIRTIQHQIDLLEDEKRKLVSSRRERIDSERKSGTGRRATDGKAKRSAGTPVRFTVDEKDEVAEQAEIAGLSLSEYVRRRAVGYRIDSKMDMMMVRELRRVFALQKHIFMSTESGKQHNDDISAVMLKCKQALDALIELASKK